ncbi:hypothetical protein ANTHELSMS3_01502 [Antarctobacter heliothermus]|uniref:Uncharacterized protein n=1 Tax=Antarctobacter heliothermus TaxID=74033 RepID=A0A222E1U9_9RHOB|nr:hypothetical protein [Antarctobacter heliothermus]ASP20199.1 hypothetical protein ANTHELSMS3_01502 [Antarctobacter heliothermus]|tara:strand:- start:2426 stop:2581 length:156 start_codon:yes stop_codon:yes gene_type:complete
MKPQRRFIASITATAKSGAPRLPFERGAPRAQMIARRMAAAHAQPKIAKRA